MGNLEELKSRLRESPDKDVSRSCFELLLGKNISRVEKRVRDRYVDYLVWESIPRGEQLICVITAKIIEIEMKEFV